MFHIDSIQNKKNRLFRQQLYNIMTCNGPYQTASSMSDRLKTDRGKAHYYKNNSCLVRTSIDERPTVGLRVIVEKS